jgi:hypothetical protein
MKNPKIAVCLLILFVSFLFTLSINIKLVYATTGSYYADYLNDIYKEGGTYSTVHDATTGTALCWPLSVFSEAARIGVGQRYSDPIYTVDRAVLGFDTSNVPAGDTISAAKVCLYGANLGDYSDTDFVIRVQKWTEAPSISTADYDGFDGHNYDDGNFNTVSWATNEYNNIIISDLSIITKAGYTYVMIRSSRDISSSTPTTDEFVFIANGDAPLGHSPYLEVTYTLSNNSPTNDALTLDLTGANYKGTKTLLTAKQDYKFVYKCSDADGVTDISYAEIRLDYSSKNVILRATRGTGDAWTFSEQSDPSNYVTLGTCSDSTSGTQKTFNFYVKINWVWGDSSETIGVRGYVIDLQSTSDQDDYSNVFGVECHLASSSLSVNDYRVNPSQTLTMSGYWYYNGTAVIPPDGDYQVKIKLSGTQKGSTDTSLVSGAFSISDVTAESTVNSYNYQVFANYNASAGSFNAVVVDKARVYYEQLDDSRININANIEFRVKAILLYDNHALGTGDTVTANFGALTWDAGNNWFDGSRTQATVGSYVFQTSSLSEATYGITSFEINVTDPTGTWDRIRIDNIGVVDGRININTEGSFYATASLEFDSHTLGSGDALTLNGHAFTWVPSRSRFEYNTTQTSVLHVTIDSFTSGNEATYGITVGDINSKSATIIWDRIQVSFVANSTGPVLNQVVLFTVALTREYDSSSITSYSYNINRNGSAFGNPHSTSTFTDVQSSQITYIYDFISVVDNTYVLTAFIDPSNITVKWTSTNHAPTIGDFSAPTSVYAGQYIFINATVGDADGRTQIANATVQLSGNVILKWLNTFNTFSIQSDPYNYVTLNQSACIRTILNDTAYLLSWNLKFAWNYSYATPSIIVTNTKVYDMYSSYGSNSKSNLFAFNDDLIVASASVNPVETTPETNVVFSGTIYYYNTTMPPYDTTGITVYLELDGLLQGATTTISSSGAWTKLIRCPATTGNKTYVIYVMTDEIGVANKTVNLFVMSTGPTGGGYFFPSGPTYRPENYTYTPPSYVPQEIAVPTGLEGLGLNILIIAIVGTTILGVGASIVKPSRPSLASKIHVKRATNSDYAKRLRRPKRKVEHK